MRMIIFRFRLTLFCISFPLICIVSSASACTFLIIACCIVHVCGDDSFSTHHSVKYFETGFIISYSHTLYVPYIRTFSILSLRLVYAHRSRCTLHTTVQTYHEEINIGAMLTFNDLWKCIKLHVRTELFVFFLRVDEMDRFCCLWALKFDVWKGTHSGRSFHDHK